MAKKRKSKSRLNRGRIVVPLAKNHLLSVSQSVNFRAVVEILGLGAGRIANQIVAQVTLTIQASGKQVAPGSFGQWKPKLIDAVRENLMLGAIWDSKSEGAVLGVAADMGTIAVLLAGSSSQVAMSQIHAAFNAVSQSHTTCGQATGGSGGGTWCNFEM